MNIKQLVSTSCADADMNFNRFVGKLFFDPAKIRAIRLVLTNNEA